MQLAGRGVLRGLPREEDARKAREKDARLAVVDAADRVGDVQDHVRYNQQGQQVLEPDPRRCRCTAGLSDPSSYPLQTTSGIVLRLFQTVKR